MPSWNGPHRRDALLGALSASLAFSWRALPAMAAPRSGSSYVFYASTGAMLNAYRVDPHAKSLVRVQGPFAQPAEVQCCWQNPRGHLYVACSDQFTTKAGLHTLGAYAVDSSGALSPLGQTVALRARPIYITGDHSGRYILAAYNFPAAVSVHAVQADGAVGAPVAQDISFEPRSYPHQIRVFPSNKAVLVMTRGNEPAKGHPEDPGALHVFSFADGKLTPSQIVAPGEGLHFRVRHADFHPSGRWVYVDLESQNQVQTYSIDQDRLSDAPLFSTATIANLASAKPGQMASAIQVHPDGQSLYVANRGVGQVEFQGQMVANGSENSVATFAINPMTGEPRFVQSADVHGIHARTMGLSPDNKWLVAATIRPASKLALRCSASATTTG
jgi:6-phosphogluconolactonase